MQATLQQPVYTGVRSQTYPHLRYITSETSCTCPDAVYRRRQCKHMRALIEQRTPAVLLSEQPCPRCGTSRGELGRLARTGERMTPAQIDCWMRH